jgi:hypothetical protein
MHIINIILYFDYKKTEAVSEKLFLEKGIKDNWHSNKSN